jgi:predicted nucleotidyltransferase
MRHTPYPDVDELLDDLLRRVRQALGEQLVGLYLYGSLVTGDFTPGVSDVDLLAAVRKGIDDGTLARLQDMHLDLVADHPAWDDRIEVAYVSVVALETFRTRESVIAAISPGEPFHTKPAGGEWLINWWLVREHGRTLYGPDPKTLIAPISQREFLDAVRGHAIRWPMWVQRARSRKSQSYARLTMCRALYAAVHGEQASKVRAARWAQERLPHHARLIEEALEWRVAEDDSAVDHGATFLATVRFVNLMVSHVEAVLG